MNNFQAIKNFSQEELSDFLCGITCDNAPWDTWFNDKYCKNCQEIRINQVGERERVFSYCEYSGVCRYFESLDEFPSSHFICSLWFKEEQK